MSIFHKHWKDGENEGWPEFEAKPPPLPPMKITLEVTSCSGCLLKNVSGDSYGLRYTCDFLDDSQHHKTIDRDVLNQLQIDPRCTWKQGKQPVKPKPAKKEVCPGCMDSKCMHADWCVGTRVDIRSFNYV